MDVRRETGGSAELGTAGTPPEGSGVLPALFESQADLQPRALAAVCGSDRATYADLEARANRIAYVLRARGVARGSFVGVLLPRSVDLYAAILGVLKAGAAYVPIDVASPIDRVEYILGDCGAKALLTTAEMARRLRFGGAVLRVDADRAAIARAGAERLPRIAGPEDLCYVIYTSGSTGRPKGVMVEHRNACHLVRTEGRLYGVRRDDRVYQGASPSFDLSVEEMWLAFHAGAVLVAATAEMAQAGPDLSRLLAAQRVTVLSTVPTLLSMLEEDVPSVRLLILGGEVCPPSIVERWARPGRRILNTYGPTETTVIATCAELAPGRKVTIGRAIPGYRVDVRDESLRPVPPGEIGEICIAGAGVARGYVGLPEQTRERFVPDPSATQAVPAARMYRTGDLGRIDADGNLEFVSRADGQVKIRGFRVELGEIEACLQEVDGVHAAACALREDAPGSQRLVGYIVASDAAAMDEQKLFAHLRERLPPFMVPSQIETIAALPLLPSGKLDRAALPAPGPRAARRSNPKPVRGLTESERRIAEVWSHLFEPLEVSPDDDFFLDLGGHSLLAARAVSALRKQPGFERVAVGDLYAHPTVRSLAAFLERTKSRSRAVKPRRHAPIRGEAPRDRRRRFVAGVIQGLSLYGVFATRLLASMTPYVVFFLLLARGQPLLVAAGWAVASIVAVFPALVVIAVTTKWLVLGRVRPGRYPLWGGYHLRFWFVRTVVHALPLRRIAGTPLLPLVCRLLGAHIEKDVYLGTDRFGAFDMISVGAGSSIDELASLNGYSVEDGELVIGPVAIGRGCYVGRWAVLGQDCTMRDYARLEDLSLLPRGSEIPSCEMWGGSPARKLAVSPPALPPAPRTSRLRKAAAVAAEALLASVYPVLFFLAIVPAMILLPPAGLLQQPLAYLLLAPLAGGTFLAISATVALLLKWTFVGRVRPGRHRVHSGFYVRYWFVDHLLKDTLEFMGQVYATLYVVPWYRALGAKIEPNVELSTAASICPDLLELADGSTVADEVSLGAPRIEGGWITVAPTRLGPRAFIGNGGIVPAGTALGGRSLVGVLSIAPADRAEAAREHASWMGSPPILLPRRQASDAFPDARTYSPPRQRKVARGLFELLRVSWPAAGSFLIASSIVAASLVLVPLVGLPATLLALPALYAAVCLTAIGAVVVAKWAVVGRYRPFARPLWSHHVWRLELVNALYEFFAVKVALEAFTGTPFLPAYLRLLGARIGRGVYLETTSFLEWDLVEIGDRTALAQDVVVQTHLFEDRVLKASRLRIGSDCSVGDASVILYDSVLEDGCWVDGLSLVMKGETLPAGTAWAGAPAVWQDPERIHRGMAPREPQSMRAGEGRAEPEPKRPRRDADDRAVSTQGVED